MVNRGGSASAGDDDRDRICCVAVLPAASQAVTVTVKPVEPSLGTDQTHVIVATSLHITTPSAANSTRVTPTSSVAVATTLIGRPFLIAVPSAGETIQTTGGVTSVAVSGSTVMTTGAEELARWSTSDGKVAATWWSPEAVGVYVTEQLEADAEPGTNAQFGDPDAPAPTAENVTSPVGATGVPPLVSRTVTVQSDGAGRVTGVPHETVVVDWRRPTAIVVVPVTTADPVSGASVAVIVWGPADPGPGVYAT